MDRASVAVAAGARFEFGKNWACFLAVLDDDRIAAAEQSLTAMLGLPDLQGLSFLDVGSGSGLSSLAAKRLGAARIHSFDSDPVSVACTRELRRRYFPDEDAWTITQGSALDADYLRSVGTFDVVYCWGVLHHTGDMWRALENVTHAVRPAGRLFIALYNDQGGASRRWATVKRLYNRSPRLVRWALVGLVGCYWGVRASLRRLVRLQNPLPFAILREHEPARGMSVWHDLVDWVGGFPFEVAKPEDVFEFCRDRGFTLQRLSTCGGGHGNNQFVFIRGTH
jgi:SAM-dependent methyltransferase